MDCHSPLSRFAAKFEAFHLAVLVHATHEEQKEFPRLRELPAQSRQAMAEDFLAVQGAPN